MFCAFGEAVEAAKVIPTQGNVLHFKRNQRKLLLIYLNVFTIKRKELEAGRTRTKILF